MMRRFYKMVFAGCLLLPGLLKSVQPSIRGWERLTPNPVQFEKTEFTVTLQSAFKNPFDSRDIALDPVIRPPSGGSMILPCYYERGDSAASVWIARFTPQESGDYTVHFRLTRKDHPAENAPDLNFHAAPSFRPDDQIRTQSHILFE